VKGVRTAGRQVLGDDGEADVEDAKEQQFISWEALHRWAPVFARLRCWADAARFPCQLVVHQSAAYTPDSVSRLLPLLSAIWTPARCMMSRWHEPALFGAC